MSDRLIVFDTTLRDGEQAPGFSMRVDEKLQMARQLDELGVDVIEAGFPIASEADAEAVRLIGARCLVSGVSPGLAAALVESGIDLPEAESFGSLADALEASIRALHTRRTA